MKHKLILSLILAFVVTNIAAADPNLVGWWKFDEGSGLDANDSAGSHAQQKGLSAELANKIVDVFQGWESITGFSQVIPLADIEANNLSVAKYVSRSR